MGCLVVFILSALHSGNHNYGCLGLDEETQKMNLENEVATNIQKIMKLLLLFSIISFTYASAASEAQANSSKPKEAIHMAMFIRYHWIFKIIAMEFE